MRPPFDIAADLDTPVSAYRRLAPFKPCFLLESIEGGARLARYSFIGLDPAFTLRIDSGVGQLSELSPDPQGRPPFPTTLTLNNEQQPGPTNAAQFLQTLRDARDRAPLLAPSVPTLPLAGGIFGAMGYDAVRFFEPSLLATPAAARTSGEPLALYTAPRSLLVFDHLTRRVALLHAGEEWERQSLRREVIHALRGPLPDDHPRTGHAPPTHSVTEPDYIDQVARAKHHITEGDVFQLVLSIRSTGECHTDPFQVYRALRLLNPSSYMYFLDIAGMNVVGSSPEALFKLNDRAASLRPIAGTRPRGDTDEADNALEAELLADPKEAAEHVMLVDLARNDLGRVAVPASVRVDPYRIIERYSHVMHLVSGVRADLLPSCDAFNLLAASFPAGTLVGTPKVRAMQLIDEIEPVSRGLYAGSVGYFARASQHTPANADQAICIRTLTFNNGRYAYQAGAGIVADSNPQAEYNEVRHKVAALEAALELAREGLS